MPLKKLLAQLAIVAVVQVVTLLLVARWLPGLTIESVGAALLVAIVFCLAQVLYWWLFVRFFSGLPVWLFPVATFVLSGVMIVLAGNLIEGVTVEGLGTGIWISLALTAVNALLGAFLSLSLDERFDRVVTQELVKRRGQPIKTDVPGFLYLEIDGLSEELFRRALEEGYLPTLRRWRDQGTHTIRGWETDFSAQTGGMQPGILLGNNDEVSAYRWWDRDAKRIVASSSPRDLLALEKRMSNGRGLLADGGTSRGNLYSGDATESLFTYSTMLDRDRSRGPGFYAYLVSPAVVARIFTHFFVEVAREWWQAWQQKRRQDKYMVSARTPWYAFFRALLGPLLQDLTTYAVINDILRGVPAIYALYAGYDDVGHFAGMQTLDAFGVLAETDHHFARIEKVLAYAPRPYHLIVLSDHGQSEGPTFEQAYGTSLEALVKQLVKGEATIFADLDTNEAWDKVNVLLSESINANTRTAAVLHTMLASKTQDGVVTLGPDREDEEQIQSKAQEAQMIVLASGCTGLIYVGGSNRRLTYEEIQTRYPELILGLVMHPGIGWVLVRSSENGDMVLGHGGINFLDKGEVDGTDPLSVYGPNAAYHLKRESSFTTCPDLLVNTRYHAESGVLCGFENQVSHHGGLGGLQNYPFIFHPSNLPVPAEPIVGATSVYRLLRGWRDTVQGYTHDATLDTATLDAATPLDDIQPVQAAQQSDKAKNIAPAAGG